MDVAFGMHVRSSDDHDLGVIDRLIISPESGTVRAAVVRRGVLLPHDVEIPLEMMEPAGDNAVRVPRTSDQVDTLPEFQPAAYTAPPAGYMPPMAYPPTNLYWPVGGYMVPPVVEPSPPDAAATDEITAALRYQDQENAEVGEGSAVLSRDGKKIGDLHQLTFDRDRGEPHRLVVRSGFLFARDTEVPASLIAGVEDGAILLSVDADDPRLTGH